MGEKLGFRFSLRTLAIVVAFLSACLAALVYASPVMAGGALLATLLVLMLSLVAAVEAKAERSFWRGFAICGWLYFLLAFSSLPYRVAVNAPELALEKLAQTMPGVTNRNLHTPSNTTGMMTTTINKPFIRDFVTIGQAWLTLLLAALGGSVGRFIHARSASTR
jgi:hypothetical protein